MAKKFQTPPGFYPDENGIDRYWNGTKWTDHQRPGAASTSTPIAANPTPSNPTAAPTSTFPAATVQQPDRPWFQKKRFIIPGALVALLIVASALGGGNGSPDGEDDTPAALTQTTTDDATDIEAPAVEEKVEEPVAEEPQLTSGQQNALDAAENYLSFAPFSRDGLVQQLSSEYGDQYPKADAEFAADNVDVDWKEQAAIAAQNYLDLSPFSRAAMIQQLSSEYGDKYTKAQAEYGATAAGL